MNLLKEKKFVVFVIKFLLLFTLFYLGTTVIIALAAPGGWYSPFVQKYLDYVTALAQSLVWGTRTFAKIWGYDTYTLPNFIVRIVDGTGIRVAFNCLGYGVMSFWAAFVIAAGNSFKRILLWVVAGWVVLWIINVIRLGLLLLAYNKNWSMPLGIDHHTWFNICAYGAIFTMMYFFDKKSKATNENS